MFFPFRFLMIDPQDPTIVSVDDWSMESHLSFMNPMLMWQDQGACQH